MKKIYILGLFSLFLTLGCNETKIDPTLFGSLVGTVLTTEDNIAIAQATISTNPPTSSLQTDELGRFSIDQIEEGTYTIRAEKEGFVTEIENVTVFVNQSTNVILRLVKESAVNSAPTKPGNPFPITGSSNVSTSQMLTWTSEDADNDELTYDVIFCTSNEFNCDTVAQNLADKQYMMDGLLHETVYFWQVRVKDGFTQTNGDLWSFETESFPDHRFLYAQQENGQFDIYSTDLEGDESIKLTNSDGDSWRPKMNPQRTKIAFLSNLGIQTHLYVMNRDGSDLTQVTSNVPVNGLNPLELGFSWSPNGAELVYPAGNELFKIGVDGIGLEKLADAPDGQMFAEVDWATTGGFLAVRTTGNNVYNSDFFLLDDEGNFLTQVYSDIPGRETGPQFSIDGNSLMYTHDITGFESSDGRQLAAHVFIKDLVNNTTIDVSEEANILAGTNDLDARYSPDGAHIVFVNTNNDGISQKNILIMDLDGDDREVLVLDGLMPDWH
jgi:TolB protein